MRSGFSAEWLSFLMSYMHLRIISFVKESYIKLLGFFGRPGTRNEQASGARCSGHGVVAAAPRGAA